MDYTLKADDTGIIIKKDGKIDLILPENKSQNETPKNVILTSILYVKLQDPEFIKTLINWSLEQYNESKESPLQ
jgi:hypothetical protein